LIKGLEITLSGMGEENVSEGKSWSIEA
jgi:hypothetical protein